MHAPDLLEIRLARRERRRYVLRVYLLASGIMLVLLGAAYLRLFRHDGIDFAFVVAVVTAMACVAYYRLEL